jgi:pimeloyl-ACP methyl ester carboxylesterase/DNA-binding CsgD family transcriptional regulator
MDQDIRFCRVDGRRLAYATVGEGPLFVFGAHWVSHLEADWENAPQRAFYEQLARSHRVVRYDRLGSGLSDREFDDPLTYERERRTFAALLDVFGDEPATLFANSCSLPTATLYFQARPERVRSLVCFGVYAARDDLSVEARRSLVDMVRANWGLASRMLAGVFAPRASGDDIAASARYQRHAATAESAAAFLEMELSVDIRALLPEVTVPALVLHRRGDQTVPFALGREVASLLPNARFVPLRGDSHFPWADDRRELLHALASFLHTPAPELNGASPLTLRETEVLRLVATGLSNREIATSLVLSEHTVHRHVANILRKLASSSRAAAATHATRAGLI